MLSNRVLALERAVLDFVQQTHELEKKNKRLHELNESSMAVTRRHQNDASDRRHRMETLKKTIATNRENWNQRDAEWDSLDSSDQQEHGEHGAFIDGLKAAWTILDTEGV